MRRALAAAAIACLVSVPAMAQTSSAQAPADPLSSTIKGLWDGLKVNLVQSAEKMPDADYAFQPTKDVRTFGQMLAHVANSSFSSCSRAKGEENPNKDDFEKTATTKADIVKAVNAAVAYCDGVYGGMSDAAAMEMVKAGQNMVPKVRYLIANISHDNEHYGNLVTYFRLKGMVPPSTERAQMRR